MLYLTVSVATGSGVPGRTVRLHFVVVTAGRWLLSTSVAVWRRVAGEKKYFTLCFKSTSQKRFTNDFHHLSLTLKFIYICDRWSSTLCSYFKKICKLHAEFFPKNHHYWPKDAEKIMKKKQLERSSSVRIYQIIMNLFQLSNWISFCLSFSLAESILSASTST